MTSPEVVALMLADGRLPTGGHTQSAGLEPAVRAGLGADGKQLADVAAYARDRLRTVTRVEAATAVLARHITLDAPSPSRGFLLENGPSADGNPRLSVDSAEDEVGASAGGPTGAAAGRSGLAVVEGAWAARTPSQVLRGVSRRQGRAYLRLAARVWPDVLRYLKRDSEVARPIVVGVIGGVTGLSAEQVARLVAYDDVQTVVAASLKLLPVDPADAATWLAGLHDDIERLVTDVAPLTEIDKLPADGAPLIDVFAQNHANERMRLFHA
ncbi:urease accessory protein [Kribbella steppae]|uniref:Urease accessory protein n=1 Tax=Kribbella steppae TaxID=2512223 RepID=A0A4R2HUC1_9ACTN|nr:urease accessory UreF family protein [Kribbella steppae]TCO34188.1 urease accessory protein [Kribbella steppae]